MTLRSIKFFEPNHTDGNSSYEDFYEAIISIANIEEPEIIFPLCHDWKKLSNKPYATYHGHGINITDENIIDFKDSFLLEEWPMTFQIQTASVSDGTYKPEDIEYAVFVSKDKNISIRKTFTLL